MPILLVVVSYRWQKCGVRPRQTRPLLTWNSQRRLLQQQLPAVCFPEVLRLVHHADWLVDEDGVDARSTAVRVRLPRHSQKGEAFLVDYLSPVTSVHATRDKRYHLD